jgi:diguanylate cyclase (GGDEF)-like protein
MLPDTDEAQALVAAERLRASVEALAVPHEATQLGVLTVSVGVASTSESRFGSWRDLTEAADEALYAAKGAGRNRVMAWQPAMANDAHHGAGATR